MKPPQPRPGQAVAADLEVPRKADAGHVGRAQLALFGFRNSIGIPSNGR